MSHQKLLKAVWDKREDLCKDKRLVKRQQMASRRKWYIFAVEGGHCCGVLLGPVVGSKAAAAIPKCG